jgi:hypothetical protein
MQQLAVIYFDSEKNRRGVKCANSILDEKYYSEYLQLIPK